MTTPTPRTDAALPSAIALRDSVLADVSRTLERELSAKSAECQRLREALQNIVIIARAQYYEVDALTRVRNTASAALRVTP